MRVAASSARECSRRPFRPAVLAAFSWRGAFAASRAATGRGVSFSPVFAQQLFPDVGFGWTVRVMVFCSFFATP